jgi:hypothetical protein
VLVVGIRLKSDETEGGGWTTHSETPLDAITIAITKIN